MKYEFQKSIPDNMLLQLTAEAVEFIESNLSNPLTVKDVTANFEKSHWLFQRLFASVVGIPIGQYLRERRLTEASREIQNSNDRVLDIAIKYGFSSEEAFSRSFKNFFNINPGEFRSSDNLVLTGVRNRLDEEKLNFFWNKVHRVPEIVTLKEKLLIGSSTEFKSHFILGSSCHQKIVPHWAEFKKRIHMIQHRADEQRIGAILSDELDLREEKLTYFSGVEVTKITEVIDGMHSITLPAGLYACFENQSVSDKHGHLIDYVYGIWLPSSQYQRRPGFDFDQFASNYIPFNPSSVSHFYIPIAKKFKSPL